ncbi:hypothetical protein DLAC_02470 [Tieghemostelium lacteum]|uniref:Uncharacterized protein n=1 Tax=Tieghemostelium lacteum TaxID=361077 RepID=A0A152A2Z0_TIELA|nr:hypothetical protein DLAC_02470 [Tieghemostelium lacteum]|eukprot:KYR00467.1 hypothetical protein DLAC_02470 [Tieghemostelium lacteum]
MGKRKLDYSDDEQETYTQHYITETNDNTITNNKKYKSTSNTNTNTNNNNNKTSKNKKKKKKNNKNQNKNIKSEFKIYSSAEHSEYLDKISLQWQKEYSRHICYRNRLMVLDDLKRRVFNSKNKLFKDYIFSLGIFGSSVYGMATVNSDIDFYLDIEGVPSKPKKFMYKLSDSLSYLGYKVYNTIWQARIPIIKFYDPYNQFHCDLAVTSNLISLANADLIQSYDRIDSRFKPLVVFIKMWAEKRQMLDGSLFISSFSWINLIIHYFQSVSIFPSLYLKSDSQLYLDKEPRILNGINCIYNDQNLDQYALEQQNQQNFAQLLLGFFQYYLKFDFYHNAISTRHLQVVKKPKDEKTDFKQLYIHCFFDYSHNLTKGLNHKKLQIILNEMKKTETALLNCKPLNTLI